MLRRWNRMCVAIATPSALAFASVLVLVPNASSGQPIPITVVLHGDPAPGTSPGVTFNFFETPVLNDGKLAFNAFVSGTDSLANSGVWGGVPGLLKLIAMEGAQVPGAVSGAKFGSFTVGSPFLTVPNINGNGKVAVWASLRGTGVTGSNGHGIWAGTDFTSLSRVARANDLAPGLSDGLKLWNLNFPRITGTGGVVFFSTIRGLGVTATNDTGLWIGPVLIEREGDPVPTLGDGTTFSQMPILPFVNHFGELAFTVGLLGSNVNASNDVALFWGAPGNLTLVVQKGDQAPSLENGVVLTSLRSEGINDLGELAFSGDLMGPGIVGANSKAIWAGSFLDMALVAQRGQDPLTTEPDVRFGDLSRVRISGGGDVVFTAKLVGTGITTSNDVGIWLWSTGRLRYVAREGSPALDTAPGVRFRTLSNQGVNALGQVMFTSTLMGPGVTSSTDSGIWVTDPDGHVQLIVREGQTVEISSGDVRTVTRWTITGRSGGQDGIPTSLDDFGWLAVRLLFRDGSDGVFIFDTVPEAGACNHPDADLDQDVDLRDFALLQIAFEQAGQLDCYSTLTTKLTGP